MTIRRVFVTPEIYPFTSGGIGRVIANIIMSMSREERTSTLVLFVGTEVSRARWQTLYPDVSLATVTENDLRVTDTRGRRFAPKWAYPHEYHFTSVLVCQTLLDLVAAHPTIEHVEFPDWGGVAFAATQEKKLGLGFANVTLSVRLHSTETILAKHETGEQYKAVQPVFDIERKALADCDQIVGQLATVANAVLDVFSFDEVTFAAKLAIHAPPVTLDGLPNATTTLLPSFDTPLVFSSKLQHFKRPALFVRAAVGLMRAVPEYAGSAFIVAHGSAGPAADALRKLVPPDLASRFQFIPNASGVERNAIIARSICVFPTAFESFCLAAYEASLLGAYPVLNASNPAFDDSTPWTADVNCVKFDGELSGLVAALEKAVRSPSQLSPVKPPEDAAPWLGSHPPDATRIRRRRPRLSVVIPHFNLGAYLLRTLESVVASGYEDLEIIVVDDASTDEYSRQVVDTLSRTPSVGLRIVQNTFNRGLSGTRNVGVAAATGEYICCVDADDLISPTFFGLAVDALEHSVKYDFVVPQTAFFTDDEEDRVPAMTSFTDYAIFFGDAFATGLFENRFSTATCMVRRETLIALRYREELESLEDWDLYARALGAGHRFLVTNSIEFFYRRRAGSMIHAPAAVRRAKEHRHDLRRIRSFEAHGIRLPMHIIRHGARESEDTVAEERELSPFARKRRKLLRDPNAFFADSNAAAIRGLGNIVTPLITGSSARRKLEKLERNPEAFFADAKIPLVRVLGTSLVRFWGKNR